jgi:hypothetical protein
MQNKTDNRNAAASEHPQCEAHLAFNLSIYDEGAEGEREEQQPVMLVGYTQSIGADALSLVGPFYHFGYRHLMGCERALQIALRLPTGTINIQGFAVRYTKISDEQITDGYMMTGPNLPSFGKTEVNCLIEVGIVVMSAGDRAKYLEYLSQLEQPQIEFKILPPLMQPAPKKTKAQRYVLPPQRNARIA